MDSLPPDVAREPSVWALLTRGRDPELAAVAQRRHQAVLRRIRAHVGRQCRCCGERFPGTEFDATCPGCKQERKRACNLCGDVFIRASRWQQRCPSCRTEGEAG